MKFKINLINTSMNSNPTLYVNYSFINMLLDYNARLFVYIKSSYRQIWCENHLIIRNIQL